MTRLLLLSASLLACASVPAVPGRERLELSSPARAGGAGGAERAAAAHPSPPARAGGEGQGRGGERAEAELGIRVEGLRLSAAGYVLDLRYRVRDAAKAAPLLDGKQRPVLVDDRGAVLGVPRTPILGSLRQTSRNGKVSTDHTYFVLFANPAKYLRPGDRVTLVVGDARLPGLTVE